MALGTVSVCLTVLVLNLHHRDVECPVPKWARVFVLHYLAGLLCVGARKPKTMAGNLLLDDHPHRLDLKAGLRRIARGVGLMRPPLRVNGYVDRYSAATGALSGQQRRVIQLGGGFDLSTDDGRRTSTQAPQRRGDHTHDWKELEEGGVEWVMVGNRLK